MSSLGGPTPADHQALLTERDGLARQLEDAQATITDLLQKKRAGVAKDDAKPKSLQQSTTPDVLPAGDSAVLRIVGLGSRGVSAVSRLEGSQHVSGAELWAVDSDKKSLGGCRSGVQTVEVVLSDDAVIGPEELAQIAGSLRAGPVMPSQEGSAGVAFMLGSASGTPGGSTLMLQLARHLRRQGFFVASALTRPFAFEGPRKMEQADALIESLQEVAHLMVVIEQDVLTKASSEVTMLEASAIADVTLEATVRSILWALKAPELLKVTDGVFVWHGRGLRSVKRAMSQPMMDLLSCPGQGALGRGQATIPQESLQKLGLKASLSMLAEDAVKAASESPFLDDKMGTATAVLCILRVPKSVCQMQHTSSSGSAPDGNRPARSSGAAAAGQPYELALQSAIQVAAQMVRALAGPGCRDIVVCPQLWDDAHDSDSEADEGCEGGVCMEASLLIIQAAEVGTALPVPPHPATAPPATITATPITTSHQTPYSSTTSIGKMAGRLGSNSPAARPHALRTASPAGTPSQGASSSAGVPHRQTPASRPAMPPPPPSAVQPPLNPPQPQASPFGAPLPLDRTPRNLPSPSTADATQPTQAARLRSSSSSSSTGRSSSSSSAVSLSAASVPTTTGFLSRALSRAGLAVPASAASQLGVSATASASGGAAATAAAVASPSRRLQWSAMSALAGGMASGPPVTGQHSSGSTAPQPTDPLRAARPPPPPPTTPPSPPPPPPRPDRVVPRVPYNLSTSRPLSVGLFASAPPQYSAQSLPLFASSSSSSSSSASSQQASAGFSSQPSPTPSGEQHSLPSPASPEQESSHGERSGERGTAPHEPAHLSFTSHPVRQVHSLVAQSLDLPPRAARWRHQQRTLNPAQPSHAPSPRRSYVLPSPANNAQLQATEVTSGGAGGGLGGGRGAQEGGQSRGSAGPGSPVPADVRSRVAGMLEKERGD
ncbi:MAG: hypothetical protein WDW36_009594 [Sanguina aurantia]